MNILIYINFLKSPLFFAPDGSGKPGLKKTIFLGIKERPAGSSFYDFGKKIF
jgi:hypothetical protein